MIRSPLALRLNADPARSFRDSIRDAARAGARGIVLDAAGELAPERLSDTGRRDLRNTLRSVQIALAALNLPTRRPFDTEDDLDVRLARADRAFAMAYELGTRSMLVRAGTVPPEEDAARSAAFFHALTELGRRAEHRGVRLAIETAAEPGSSLASALSRIDSPGLGASVDPAAQLRVGQDPVASVVALAGQVIHAYAADAAGGSGLVNPRGFAFPGGVLDWEAYLGALEEIDYRGFLTVWPDPARDPMDEFAAMKARLDRY